MQLSVSESNLPHRALWSRLQILGPYAPVAFMFLVGLLLLSLSRAGLMVWQAERVMATGIWPEILLQGIRVDVIQLGLLAIPLVLLVPVLGTRRLWPVWRILSVVWVVLSIVVLVLLEVSTPTFIAEYDARPNRLFVEYLKYPHEVIAMLWGGFRLELFAGIALTALAGFGMAQLMRPWREAAHRGSDWVLWLTWPLVFLLLALAIRSTLDHRPANPALFALSNDTMVNSLILNSAWSVAHAVYAMRNEARSSEIYGKLASDEIIEAVKAARVQSLDDRPWLDDEAAPTLIAQSATHARERPLNLVIILEESLGATFVGSLGGVGVTPELERLKAHGWWFEQLYATGTRSIRGIEAVVTGFPPMPAQAVVKLDLAQENFSTLAQILGPHGYESEFIYGGESHFDNMRRFLLGNGFSRVTDQKDYVNPVFSGSWGVSDEDLLNKTHERLLQKHAEGKASFTFVFTSSNHSPFEFPDGRIELHEEPKGTENNAVKYADYALGRFFDQAMASPYWQDTVFLVVADHDIRVRGDTLVPVERFHIPGLILGADIPPRSVTTVASQIDLAPTLLSLIGVSSAHPMIGRDLTREPDGLPGRAMMQYDQHYAWMEGNQVVVLRPEKPAAHGVYDPQSKRLSLEPPPEQAATLERRALAHALLPAWLYREQRYRVPDDALPQLADDPRDKRSML